MSRSGCIRSNRCSLRPSPGSGAVIGMAGQNGRGPIYLFQKHDADHLMRPGRRAERNAQFSLALQIGRKSVRAADCENSICASLIAPATEMAVKRGAIDVLAALVERHKYVFFRYQCRDRGGLFGNAAGRITPPALRNFMNLKAAKAKLAADVVKPLAIALGQFPLRALLQPADCNDDEAH